MIREAFKDLARMRQIAAAVVRHGFGEVLARSRMAGLAEKAGTVVSADELRKSAARRFRELLDELGPTFVKLGQTLSTRPDLLPAELVDELSSLQDRAAPLSIEVVRKQIERGLGKPADQLFEAVVHQPLASASIAQVHLATTHDGQEVVVKVQRPDIAESIKADLDLLYYLAWALDALFEEAGIYQPLAMVEEFDRTLRDELDFALEADNIKAFEKTHAGRAYVRIPKVYDALSSRTVLTLERLRGTKITELDHSVHDRKKVVQHLVEGSFRQLFEDGLFHGDPHPGNVLVLDGPGEVIGLIDFGVVGRINKAMQETIVTLVMAVALRDADTVARLLYRVGVPSGRANLTAFRDDIAQILDKYLGRATLKEIEARSLMRDLLDLAVRYRIRVPREYAVLGRSAVLVEGIIRQVYPDMNVLEVAGPYAKQLLRDRLEPTDLQGGLMKLALRMQGFAAEVPLQLSQIMLDLETGKLSVTVKSDEIQRVADNVKSLGVTVFMGLLACGFVVGAFLSFARMSWEAHGLPVAGIAAVLISGGLFGAALSWYFFSGRIGKIRLSRWLKR